jgi:uncharacterized repeat protein (TIGR02543 family)
MGPMHVTRNSSRLLIFSSLVIAAVLAQVSFAQVEQKAVVVETTSHAFVPSLRDLAPITAQTESQSTLSADTTLLTGEAVAEATTSASLATTPGLDILGVGNGVSGFNVNLPVASPNGAAGTTQFVQWVNASIAVFNKSTGSMVLGPTHPTALWQAAGGPCATSEPNMDGIAQFDKLANVWVLLMPIYSTPSYFCVAVSTTSDATGSWNLYTFALPVSSWCNCRLWPDYPKVGVWPDAYYISYHQTGNNDTFDGPGVCAVNRSQMLNGASSASMQCFVNNGPNNMAWLPSDLDGTTPPPSGSPNYLAAFDRNDHSLDIWQLHLNWTTPASSTLTGPTNIPVTAFLEGCGDTYTVFTPSDNCVPQAGTTEMLGEFGDELMYRVAYRNYGGYQALALNHTVTVASGSTQTGIRWYELRNTGSGFGLYQEGTYAPDSNYRWMGSIAMDKVGDMAIGYSISSNALSPSIRYTGRQSTDTLGTMEGEVDVLTSANIAHTSQTNSVRWGDYASIAVDPVDDCTFWFTTQYMPTNGNNWWSTRIASFNFPACKSSVKLTLDEVGKGTVTSADATIDCVNGSGGCSAPYPNGSAVSLTATPVDGYTFSGWSGACSGGNPCNVTMTSAKTATATFAAGTLPNYVLTIDESGQGTVKSTDGQINCVNGNGNCSATYPSGTSVSLNAAPPSGSTFLYWSGAGACEQIRGTCTVTLGGNLTVTGSFATTPTWAIVHKTSNAGSIANLTVPVTGSGHLIAVALMFNNTTSVTGVSDNAGNNYISAGVRSTNGPNSVEVWLAEDSAAGATVITPNFVNQPGHVEITAWEVSGVLAMPLDATNTSTGTFTADNTAGPAVTTTLSGDFVISVMMAVDTNLTGSSSGSNFTNDFTSYGNGWAHLTSNSSSPGVKQASWFTSNPTGGYCAATVAFAP